MGWRFRKSFRVIPGLRLNLSKSGLSASIGGAPFTFNVGPRGVMGTASIPGTGISYRQHFGSVPQADTPPPHSPSPSYFPAPPELQPSQNSAPVEQIHSASTELLTSESLKELKQLMQMTFEEREDISRHLNAERPVRQRALSRYESWENGFLFKKLFKAAFARRTEEAETASAKVSEFEEQLRLTTVATQIEISKEQAEPYFKMRDAFAALCECSAIWDIKSRQATDMLHERTTAATRIERERVSFSVDSSDLIQWEQKVPRLKNAKGGDLFLYPGFILYRAARSAFSVLDYHDVMGNLDICRFQEEEGVPSDSKVVAQAWAKANKDGGPDRRFANNYQIPVAAYAHLKLKSSSGLWEEFHFSNVERTAQFATTLGEFEKSFAPQLKEPVGKPN
jgi:hypothetical protein